MPVDVGDHLAQALSHERPLEALRFHWWEHGKWLSYRGSGLRMTVLLEGEMAWRRPRGRAHSLTPGQLLVLPANWRYHARAVSRQGVVECRFLWHEASAAVWLAEDQALLGTGHPWPSLPLQVDLDVHLPWDHLLKSVLGDLSDRYTARTWWHQLTEWSRHPAAVESPWANAPVWLQSAISGLDGKQLLYEGVSALARLAGRSPDHCTRVLRATCGCSSTDVVNHRRLSVAAKRLRLTDDPIHVIATQLGFTNRRHFYDLFKNRYGTTPAQWRSTTGH